jgi:hypothetical protein
MLDLADAASKAAGWAKESVGLLRDMDRRVVSYLGGD